MADLDNSFTGRIIHRASLRRNRESLGALTASKEVLQRRHNILRAINDSSSRRGSCIGINDSHQFDQSYSQDVLNCTEISNNNNNDESSTDAYKKIDSDLKKSESIYSNFWETGNPSKSDHPNPVSPRLAIFNQPKNHLFRTSSTLEEDLPKTGSKASIKVEEAMDSPPKVISEVNSTQTTNTDVTSDLNLTEATESFIAPTLATFDDSDSDSEKFRVTNFTTEAVIEMCKKVYTVLDRDCSEPEGFRVEKLPSRTPRGTPKKFVTSSEAPTLESPRKLTQSEPRKRLFSNSSSLVPVAMDQKYGCSENWDDSLLGDSVPYDEDKFLSDALGDELYKMSVTYDESYTRDRTRSDFTASDLMSDDDYPSAQKKKKKAHKQAGHLSPRNSSTLDTSIRIYRSLSERIKRKFRPRLRPKKEPTVAAAEPSSSEEIDRIQDLLQIVKAQQTLMNETAKVLHAMDVKQEYMSNAEQVDSERSLLIASLRRKAALEEIKSITSDDGNKKSAAFREEAEITLSGMSVGLRSESQSEVTEWFVVAVTQGLNVWVTRAVSCAGNNRRLRFTESIAIPNLNPGFKIVVQVYSLRLKPAKSSEDKPRMRKESKSTSCLPYPEILASPTKLFKKTENPVLQDQNNAWKTRHSAFVLSGFTELFLHDLSAASPWSLMLVPENSRIKGNIDMNLACRLHLATSHEGFLNFYEEISGLAAWNRRWCVLKGHTLMFWNYPREQDIKEPLKMIELMRCVSNEIATVDRTISPKPRTLLIETERCRRAGDRNSIIVECTSTSTFVRNLLSFDSAQELNDWSEKLNHVLLALEEWHIIGQRTQPQVSDL